MRKNLEKLVSQDLENDVYFWDGNICVRSTAITIGNPPSVTISVPNLSGVSVQREQTSLIVTFATAVLLLFFMLMGFGYLPKYPVIGSFFLLLCAWPAARLLRSDRWEVTLKQGGILADESFTSRSQQWSHQLCQAVSQAISASRSSGSGGHGGLSTPIFPNPVLTRN